ncbi:MAG: hypothetical protein KatS3mg105_1944 [Gemmatales bacterium]|nr:MAG: hypothetical protein KatS3mg105_1944 [Gemmatales bacterium]
MQHKPAGRRGVVGQERRPRVRSTRACMLIVGGMVLSVALLPAEGQETRKTASDGSALEKTPTRPARVYGALSKAIEYYRKGDYGQAARYLREAKEGKDLLSPANRQELHKYILLNNAAVKARREGSEQLREAEAALKAGDTQKAEALLDALRSNRFLSDADRKKARELTLKMQPPAPPEVRSPTAVARAKLQQARILMNKGDFKAAQTLAYEVLKLNGVAYDPNEDNPKKVLDDIAAIKSDGKALLKLARDAIKRGDFDRAEELVTLAEKAGSSRRFFPNLGWGDTPAKVRRDIEAARQAKPKMEVATPAPEKPKQEPPRRRFDIFRNLFRRSNDPDTQIVTPETKPVPPPVAGDDQSKKSSWWPSFWAAEKTEKPANDSVSVAKTTSNSSWWWWPSFLSSGGNEQESKPEQKPSVEQTARHTNVKRIENDRKPVSPYAMKKRTPGRPTVSKPIVDPALQRVSAEKEEPIAGPVAAKPGQDPRPQPRLAPRHREPAEPIGVRGRRKPEQFAAAKRTVEHKVDTKNAKAQELLQQARQAIAEKKFREAQQLVNRAHALGATYHWWDDTPAKVAEDLLRAARETPGAPGGPGQRSGSSGDAAEEEIDESRGESIA